MTADSPSSHNTLSPGDNPQPKVDTNPADTGWNFSQDETRARRISSLAAFFMNHEGRVAENEIKRRFYEDVDKQNSFLRAFSRDRQMLETLGYRFIKYETNPADSDGRFWQIDSQKTFFSYKLTLVQARTLECLTQALVFDTSFAYADELRLALTKISARFPYSLLPLCENASEREGVQSNNAKHKAQILSCLIEALSQKRLIACQYKRANDEVKDYVLAPLGTFGFHNASYVVAEKMSKDNEQNKSSMPQIHSFRNDRFVSACMLKKGFTPPQHFDVNAYIKLPCHIGTAQIPAKFALVNALPYELMRKIERSGTLSTSERRIHVENTAHDTRDRDLAPCKPTIWETTINTLVPTVRMALETGMVPLDPPQLVTLYENFLQRAQKLKKPSFSCKTLYTAPAQKGRRGRTSADKTLRQLLLLLAHLQKSGDSISCADIMSRFACTQAEAQKLLQLMLEIADDTRLFSLPLVYDEYEAAPVENLSSNKNPQENNSDQVHMRSSHQEESAQIERIGLFTTLSKQDSAQGRSLRLSLSEVAALREALANCGIEARDALLHVLDPNEASKACARTHAHTKPIAQHAQTLRAQSDKTVGSYSYSSDKGSERAKQLITIAQAEARKQALTFAYEKAHPKTQMRALAYPDSKTQAAASDTTPRYLVIPNRLFRSNQNWYLWAFDIRAQMMKTFAVEKMRELEPTQIPADVQVESNAPAHTAVHTNAHTAVHTASHTEASIKLYLPATSKLLEELFWPENCITRFKEGYCIQFSPITTPWLIKRIFACADELQIDDNELSNTVKNEAKQQLALLDTLQRELNA